MSDQDEGFALVAAERRDLADRLETLTAEQWRTHTLCREWSVRDMAAHLTVGPTVSIPELGIAMLRSRGSFHRANRLMTERRAAASPAELVQTLRDVAGSRFTPPRTDWRAPLAEVLLHREDIARPLGGWERDPAPWTHALDFLLTGMARGGFVRASLRGIRFEATDLDWSANEGPLVRGTAAELGLLMTGREASLPSVTGDGLDELYVRTRPRS